MKDKIFDFLKIIILFIYLLATNDVYSQKNFSQRVSSKAAEPHTGKTIYNLRGDFELIGNVNLIKRDYNHEGNNNTFMKYVDVDDDASTINSSSAYLNIPNHNCVKIVYAGLYWGGRAEFETNTSDNVAGSKPQLSTNGSFANIYNGTSDASKGLNIIQGGTSGNRYPIYLLTLNSGKIVEFHFTNVNNNNNRVYYLYNGGQYYVNGSYNNGVFNLTNNLTIVDGNYNYIVSSLGRGTSISNNNSFTNYSNYINISSPTVINNQNITKNLNKKVVKLKKENGSYHTVTASSTDIWYPSGNAGSSDNQYGIYAAYADVTDVVKTGGTYYLADLALREGESDGQGYSGGWGMVVIYEDVRMPYRDITIFDGHRFIRSGDLSINPIELTGFNSAQNGDINVDMGFIAFEGENNFRGDYFRMRRPDITSNPTSNNILNSSSSYNNPLSSANGFSRPRYPNISTTNTTRTNTNFFNSSIYTGYAENIDLGNNTNVLSRTPHYINNYGFDLAKISLDNSEKIYIKNSQQSTAFYYGGEDDTYVINTIIFAVDAYIPDAHAVNLPKKITKANPAPGELPLNTESEIAAYMNKLQPGDIVEMEMEISNYGNERIRRSRIDIVLPESMKLYDTPTVVNTGGNVHIKPIPNPLPRTPQPVPPDPDYPIDYRQTLNDNNFPNAVWKADLNSNASINYQYGGILQWNLGTIPAQELPNNITQKVALSKLSYNLIVTNDCELLKYSNETCKVKPIIKGDVWGLGEFSGSGMKPKFIIGYEEDCYSTPIYGDNEFNISPNIDFLNSTCNANDIEKDLILEFPCASISANNSVEINKNLILYKDNVVSASNLRYPIGTLFYTVSPITPGYQSSLVDFTNINSFTANLNQVGNDLVDYLYVVLPINQIGEEYYNCFYTVTIKVSSLTEVPTISNPIIEVCIGNTYSYEAELSTEGTEKQLTLKYFISSTDNIGSTIKPMPTQQGVHNYWVAQGILNPDGTTWCYSDKVPFSIIIKGCSMKVNPQIYNKFKRP